MYSFGSLIVLSTNSVPIFLFKFVCTYVLFQEVRTKDGLFAKHSTFRKIIVMKKIRNECNLLVEHS